MADTFHDARRATATLVVLLLTLVAGAVLGYFRWNPYLSIPAACFVCGLMQRRPAWGITAALAAPWMWLAGTSPHWYAAPDQVITVAMYIVLMVLPSMLLAYVATALAILIAGHGVQPHQYKGPPCCPECGYNLSGNVSGRCPECGWAV